MSIESIRHTFASFSDVSEHDIKKMWGKYFLKCLAICLHLLNFGEEGEKKISAHLKNPWISMVFDLVGALRDRICQLVYQGT